ncbi:hypothetical protein BP5796_01287 [Coleophoma crateriformis]|uniref:Uncharacterized protein n=1 Tax=Coleophoma crateriformis TaxID=565419 RepID=A0A3D8SZZ6_9HELO|nr:hypothetical protein BP5796_01287 [Coleophoma crateriformis]
MTTPVPSVAAIDNVDIKEKTAELDALKTVHNVNTEEKWDIEPLPNNQYDQFEIDDAYPQKVRLVNDALQSIGMTGWQYKMWALCGFDWIMDNVRLCHMIFDRGSCQT